MIIKTKQNNPEYQYSTYEPGDVLEVKKEYDNHYVCRFLSGSHADDVCVVHKDDCEEVHLGSYNIPGEEIHMKL